MPMYVHNHMKEKNHQTSLQCESLNDRDHDDDKNEVIPISLKCQGRPMNLPRKAHSLPFDRHDWCIETDKELKIHIIDYHY